MYTGFGKPFVYAPEASWSCGVVVITLDFESSKPRFESGQDLRGGGDAPFLDSRIFCQKKHFEFQINIVSDQTEREGDEVAAVGNRRRQRRRMHTGRAEALLWRLENIFIIFTKFF